MIRLHIVPMGFHQIVEFARRRRSCSCDRRWIEFAHDVACPIHGLVATLRPAVRRHIRDAA